MNGAPSSIVLSDRTRAVENLSDLVSKAKHGERILVAVNPFYDEWMAHPEGVAFKLYNEVTLNGRKKINLGWWVQQLPARKLVRGTKHEEGSWCIHESGMAWYEGEQIFNGQWDEAMVHPKGLLVRTGEEFILVVAKPDQAAA